MSPHPHPHPPSTHSPVFGNILDDLHGYLFSCKSATKKKKKKKKKKTEKKKTLKDTPLSLPELYTTRNYTIFHIM